MEKIFINIHPFPGAHVHVIGIGGASMSGLARILRERGYTVSGSDRVENEAVQALRADGFHVAVGHRAENVRGADLVVCYLLLYSCLELCRKWNIISRG